MIIDKELKRYIKQNHIWLERLFKLRIEELKANVFNMETGQPRDDEIRFIKEFRAWLGDIKIIIEPKQEKKDNFV